MDYSEYYQARVEPSRCWYVTAILRSHEHMCFDRSLDPQNSIFEFFVPASMESLFVVVMNHFIQKGLVHSLQKMPNRLHE
jgi:hypothetical protein